MCMFSIEPVGFRFRPPDTVRMSKMISHETVNTSVKGDALADQRGHLLGRIRIALVLEHNQTSRVHLQPSVTTDCWQRADCTQDGRTDRSLPDARQHVQAQSAQLAIGQGRDLQTNKRGC